MILFVEIFLSCSCSCSFPKRVYGVETEETRPSRKGPVRFQFVFLRFPFLAIGKNLKTKALNSAYPLPSFSFVHYPPALKSPQPPLPFIDAGSRPFLRSPQVVSVALSNRPSSLYSCGSWRCGVFLALYNGRKGGKIAGEGIVKGRAGIAFWGGAVRLPN